MVGPPDAEDDQLDADGRGHDGVLATDQAPLGLECILHPLEDARRQRVACVEIEGGMRRYRGHASLVQPSDAPESVPHGRDPERKEGSGESAP